MELPAAKPTGHLIQGLVLATLCGLSNGIVPALGPQVESDLAISHSLLGLVLAGTFLGNIGGSLLAGPIVARRGLRDLGVLSAWALFLGNLLAAAASVWLLFLGRALLGLAAAGALLFVSCLVVHAFAQRQGGLLTLLHGVIIVGVGVSLWAAAPLAAALGNWTRAPLLVAGLTLPVALGLMLSGKVDFGRDDGRNLLGPLRHPAVWAMAPLLLCYIMAESATLGFFVTYAVKEAHYSQEQAAGLVSLLVLGIVLGRLLVALVRGRGAPAGLLALLTIVGAAGFAGSALLPGKLLVGASLLVAGLAAGPVPSLGIARVVDQIGHSRTSVLALCNLIMCLGGAISYLAVGAVGDLLSLRSAMLGASALFLLSSAPLIRLRRRSLPAAAPSAFSSAK